MNQALHFIFKKGGSVLKRGIEPHFIDIDAVQKKNTYGCKSLTLPYYFACVFVSTGQVFSSLHDSSCDNSKPALSMNSEQSLAQRAKSLEFALTQSNVKIPYPSKYPECVSKEVEATCYTLAVNHVKYLQQMENNTNCIHVTEIG